MFLKAFSLTRYPICLFLFLLACPASLLAGPKAESRELVLYDFETPGMGKFHQGYAGGLSEGSLSRRQSSARTGRWGGRLEFAYPPEDAPSVAWDYQPVAQIVEGARTLSLWYRTSVSGGEAYCHIFDAAGEQFQFRAPLPATGRFERITFALDDPDARTPGESSDKAITYPLRRLFIGIRAPGKSGTADIDSLVLTTTASEDAQPAVTAELAMEPFGHLLKPGETPKLDLYVSRQESGPGRAYTGTYRVADWQGRDVKKGSLDAIQTQFASPAKRTITLDGLEGSGAFCLHVKLTNTNNPRDVVETKTWFGVLPSASVQPAPWVGTCLHWDHGWGNGEMRVFDIMKDIGIGIVRQDISWPSWERSPGKYRSVSIYDRLADELKKRGIEWNFVFYRNHTGYENQLDPDAHARFAAWLAKRYEGKVRYFEIWNEAANCFFRPIYGEDKTGRGIWVDKFVEFTNKTAAAIKQARPDATVLVASEDIYFRLQEMLDKGIGKNADVIAIHTYTRRTLRPETGEFLGDGLEAMRAYCRRNNAPQRVAITEAGWTTCAGDTITHLDWAGSFEKTTYAQQAFYLIRMYLLAHAAGVEYVMNYDFMNDGPQRDYTEDNFGIVHEDFSPKPSLLAIAAMTRLLGKSQFEKELFPNPAQARVQVYRTAGNHRVVAAWSVEGNRNIRLKTKAEKVELVDLMGNRRTVDVTDGALTLPLTEIPVYVLVADDDEMELLRDVPTEGEAE